LVTSPPATARETAAITAALVRFARDTAPPAAPRSRRSPWQRAAFLEDTGRAPASPWGDHTPWG
jgi:hypothetical protein